MKSPFFLFLLLLGICLPLYSYATTAKLTAAKFHRKWAGSNYLELTVSKRKKRYTLSELTQLVSAKSKADNAGKSAPEALQRQMQEADDLTKLTRYFKKMKSQTERGGDTSIDLSEFSIKAILENALP